MKRVRLERRASTDLLRAFDYSRRHFGDRQAIIYVEGLRARIMDLPLHPFAGRLIDESADLRLLVHKLHIIRYRVSESEIVIVRIIDARRRDAQRT